MDSASSIINKMATCPLKHFIREKLWEKYITKLSDRPIKYLTLYCPPLMDVKHFCRKGYILLESGVYRNVVGITNDPDMGESYTISKSHGRLELFKVGLLHELLDAGDKELKDRFPFTAINLDYCNHLFGSYNNEYLSSNLKDIELIIELQKKKNCGEFVLFITTRTDRNTKNGRGFAYTFTRDLSRRIKHNIELNDRFKQEYNKLFSNISPCQIAKTHFMEFISLGILKLILMTLWENDFFIDDCDAYWLIRDEGFYQRDLLHVAIFVKRFSGEDRIKPRQLKQLGQSWYKEKGSTLMLERITTGKMIYVKEKADQQRLLRQYGDYIQSLNEETFDLPIATPKNEN